MEAEAWRSVQHLLEEYLSGSETNPEEWSRPRIVDAELRRMFLAAVAAHEEREATWTSSSTPRVPGFDQLTLVGIGGQSEVYRALQPGLENRRVALKLPRRLGSAEFGARRFRKEVAALARVKHSNVAQIYDACEAEDGRPVLVMELVEGLTLASYCRTNRPTLRQRLNLLLQASAGVAAAQAEGIVHRDIKPSNVLVQLQVGGAAVKVIDFGVAKHLEDTSNLTADGDLVGTFQYMSPEQLGANYGPISFRTDVYALGILAYELTYDRHPFAHIASPAPGEHLAAREQGPRRPPRIDGEEETAGDVALLRGLAPLIARSLAVQPGDRYDGAAAFHGELRALLEQQAVRPAPALETVRRQVPLGRRWLLPAGLLAVAAVVGIATLLERTAGDAPTTALDQRATTTEYRSEDPAASSDGALDRSTDAPAAAELQAAQPGEREGRRPEIEQPVGPWVAGSQPGETRVNPHDGIGYAWVPAGRFLYGCSPGDSLCEDDEGPAAERRLEGFWLGGTEVTVKAYRRVGGASAELPPAPSFNPGWRAEAHPVVNVTRFEAERYCESAATRLPTEAEWEYAARGGRERGAPRSLGSEAWFANNAGGRTHEVGQKAANPLGLYDMLGNALEWVAGEPSGSGQVVLRGGSWLHDARYQRFSFRMLDSPARREPMYGFRCAIDPR